MAWVAARKGDCGSANARDKANTRVQPAGSSAISSENVYHPYDWSLLRRVGARRARHESRLQRIFAVEIGEGSEAAQRICAGLLRQLALDGDETPAPLDEQIHLVPVRRPPEPQWWPLAFDPEMPQHLPHHKAFPQRAGQWRRAQEFNSLDAEQVAGEPNVDEVQFRRFDEAFRQAPMVCSSR
jgi:hypothetical protein